MPAVTKNLFTAITTVWGVPTHNRRNWGSVGERAIGHSTDYDPITGIVLCIPRRTRGSMIFEAGDEVTVDFQGHLAAGEVVAFYKKSGFILCRIHADPAWDYDGAIDPEPFVCVRQDRVKPKEEK